MLSDKEELEYRQDRRTKLQLFEELLESEKALEEQRAATQRWERLASIRTSEANTADRDVVNNYNTHNNNHYDFAKEPMYFVAFSIIFLSFVYLIVFV